MSLYPGYGQLRKMGMPRISIIIKFGCNRVVSVGDGRDWPLLHARDFRVF